VQSVKRAEGSGYGKLEPSIPYFVKPIF